LGNGYYKFVNDGNLDEVTRISDKSISTSTAIDKNGILIEEVDDSPLIKSSEDLGNFYLLITSFEVELRIFIKSKFGKGFYKRLKNELTEVYAEWISKKNKDERWGIKPEKELINYSLLFDYIQILKKYQKLFAKGGSDEMNDVITQLKQFANYGRNPIMHCRTLTHQKYYTTISSVNYLKRWMNRNL
jgi:hypothetical protein